MWVKELAVRFEKGSLDKVGVVTYTANRNSDLNRR